MYSRMQVSELKKKLLNSLSKIANLVSIPNETIPKRKEIKNHYYFGQPAALFAALPKNLLNPAEELHINSLWVEFCMALGPPRSDFLIDPEEIKQAINEIAAQHLILDDFLKILAEPSYNDYFTPIVDDPERLLKSLENLFSIDLSDTLKKYRAKQELDERQKQYMNLIGEDLFKTMDEIYLFQTFVLNRVSKTFSTWSNHYFKKLGHDVFFKYVLPHVFALQAEQLLNKTASESKATPSFLVGPLDNKLLFEADVPTSENEIVTFLNYITQNKIHHAIIILDANTKCNWFKVGENFLEQTKSLSADRRKQLEAVAHFGPFTIRDITTDRYSVTDLREKPFYKLNIKKNPDESTEGYNLDIYFFKAKDNQFDPDKNELDFLADLYEIHQLYPVIVQANNPILRASFKLAFQLASLQLQKRSRENSSVNSNERSSPFSFAKSDSAGSSASLKPLTLEQPDLPMEKKEVKPKVSKVSFIRQLPTQETADIIVGTAKKLWKGMGRWMG